MKSFVYGIDGGDKRIFDYFDMPFYRKLVTSHVHLELTEDLINRGWSEIITGARGRDTGGFYMSPELDGTTNLSVKYRMGEVTEQTGIKLIWDALPASTRVGIMNVPSLLPVVPVNGFCVGSAGAGISKIDQISDDLAYPAAVREYLNEQNYIADLRLNSSDIEYIDEWFSVLKEMETKRIDCYLKLARRYEIEFGLLIDRATTVVQYLFMSEIDALIARDAGQSTVFQPTERVERLLREFYAFVDDNIRRLVEFLEPQQFILTSDHGHEPMRFHCNPNAVLQQEGLFLPRRISAGNHLKNRARNVLKKLPRRYKRRIRSSLGQVGVKSVPAPTNFQQFDKERTLAFSHFQVPGIYLNDERFGGPVRDENAGALVERLCLLFNEHPESHQYGISAVPCRSQHLGSRYSDKLPDVRLLLPDHIFTTCMSSQYVERNPVYGPVPNFDKVGSEMHTGTKGSRPLCVVDPATAALCRDGEDYDLTIVYKLVDRFFENAPLQ